jgi:hypothetical protein
MHTNYDILTAQLLVEQARRSRPRRTRVGENDS